MKISEFRKLIREEVRKVIKEDISNKVKIETNKGKIDLLIRKFKRDITLLTKDDYDNIVAIAYGDIDNNNRLQSLIRYMEDQIGKEPSGNLGYEFIEYINGKENSFTM